MIFVDVGSHAGQTLVEVTRPVYGFRLVHAIEPMPDQFEVLRRVYGDNPLVRLHEYGLAYETGPGKIYGSNESMEASMLPRKRDVDESIVHVVEFVSAASFFRAHVHEPAVVKLNCEGAEVAILDSLVDGDQLGKIHHMLVDFDIRKVDGAEYEERRILAKLARAGFDRYVLSEEVMRGETHEERIRAWLVEVFS